MHHGAEKSSPHCSLSKHLTQGICEHNQMISLLHKAWGWVLKLHRIKWNRGQTKEQDSERNSGESINNTKRGSKRRMYLLDLATRRPTWTEYLNAVVSLEVRL